MSANDIITVEERPRAKEPAGSATDFAIRGMTCGNCARHVREAVERVAGVRSATVDLEGSRASVRWADGGTPNPDAVVEAVRNAGYGAEQQAAACHAKPEGERKIAGWQLNLWVGVLGTVPLMLGEWVFGWALLPWFQWMSFVVGGIVQLVAGAPFYRGAWNQLKARSSNMDTLVALGSTTAFAYSVWALFSGAGGHLYFMEAASIITVVSVGHWIESRVSARASTALRALLNLSPQKALRLGANGKESEVEVSELQPGDLVVLRPGDRVPVDAEVIKGNSAVDEAMLTGESIPVEKSPGKEVFAGTINKDGRLIARVKATGNETALAHIIEAVQRAQDSRANIQRLADRVSNVFVPIVVVIAAAAGLWWGFAHESALAVHNGLANYLWPAHPPDSSIAAGFIIAAAVLIVACPCAMGLATPAAIMAGANVAAERGILIRDGVALEKAGVITAVLFDKTGTLTIGQPKVVAVWPSEDLEAKELAAALAGYSKHPISQAIAGLSTKEPMKFEDWKEIRGAGLQASARTGSVEQIYRLGALRWLQELNVDCTPGKSFLEEWSCQGATVVGLSRGPILAAMFAVKDTLKHHAKEVVQNLKQQGLSVYLITGDNQVAASSIAAATGIPSENVFGEVRPEKKSEIVRKLQQGGHRVAFVGDGINDAPALEQADLGIAVSRASDIAREAADIILLKSEIEAVPESLALSRATLRTIRQNLFWAFFYNSVGIPLTALGFLSPVLCAAAMGLSDIIVIGNALRLRRWKQH